MLREHFTAFLSETQGNDSPQLISLLQRIFKLDIWDVKSGPGLHVLNQCSHKIGNCTKMYVNIHRLELLHYGLLR